MPIDYQVDHDLRLVVIDYIGQVTDADLLGMVAKSLVDPGRGARFDSLSDMTGADLSALSVAAIRELAEDLRSVQTVGRNAIYAPKPLPYGLSRMFGSMVDEVSMEVAVFGDLAAARAWLGLPNQERGSAGNTKIS